MSGKLSALPPRVVRELCQHLNMEGAGVRNWRDLITKVPGSPYDIFACEAFARNGLRPYTSPAEQVIADFIAKGIHVDQLYCMLADMDAWGCMEVLEAHVSPAVAQDMREKREVQRSDRDWNLQLGSHDGLPDHTPSPDEHPEFGALPSRPPPDTPISSLPLPPAPCPAPGHTSYLPHQQLAGQPHHYPSTGSLSSTNASSPTHFIGQPHPPVGHIGSPTHLNGQLPRPPGSYMTGSSSETVFTDGSSSDYTDTSSPSSQATPTSSGRSLKSTSSDYSASMNMLHFSYAELSEATGGFTEGMVGIGAFGTVFRAKIRGNGPYAIKKLHTETEMGVHCGQFYEAFHQETFSQELQLLTRYHHKNILSLVAHSNDGYRPCLVYEYMEFGSLSECLQGKRGVHLSCDVRVSIATQVAEALHFLHTVNMPTCLVHGDIKSANILLDAHLIPKLSDFGLARELTSKPNSRSAMSTRSSVVMGTMAYMAPEFLRNKKLTTRTDVYAFGVVMLELYTGQPAFSTDPSIKDKVLTDRLSELLEDSELRRDEVLMSADHRAAWPPDTALGLFDIITVCLQSKQRLRLPIRQVLDQLVILPQ